MIRKNLLYSAFYYAEVCVFVMMAPFHPPQKVSGTDYPRKYKPEDVNIIILNASNNVPFIPSTAFQHFNPFIFPIRLPTKINQHQWYDQKQYHMAHTFV